MPLRRRRRPVVGPDQLNDEIRNDISSLNGGFSNSQYELDAKKLFTDLLLTSSQSSQPAYNTRAEVVYRRASDEKKNKRRPHAFAVFYRKSKKAILWLIMTALLQPQTFLMSFVLLAVILQTFGGASVSGLVTQAGLNFMVSVQHIFDEATERMQTARYEMEELGREMYMRSRLGQGPVLPMDVEQDLPPPPDTIDGVEIDTLYNRLRNNGSAAFRYIRQNMRNASAYVSRILDSVFPETVPDTAVDNTTTDTAVDITTTDTAVATDPILFVQEQPQVQERIRRPMNFRGPEDIGEINLPDTPNTVNVDRLSYAMSVYYYALAAVVSEAADRRDLTGSLTSVLEDVANGDPELLELLQTARALDGSLTLEEGTGNSMSIFLRTFKLLADTHMKPVLEQLNQRYNDVEQRLAAINSRSVVTTWRGLNRNADIQVILEELGNQVQQMQQTVNLVEQRQQAINFDPQLPLQAARENRALIGELGAIVNDLVAQNDRRASSDSFVTRRLETLESYVSATLKRDQNDLMLRPEITRIVSEMRRTLSDLRGSQEISNRNFARYTDRLDAVESRLSQEPATAATTAPAPVIDISGQQQLQNELDELRNNFAASLTAIHTSVDELRQMITNVEGQPRVIDANYVTTEAFQEIVPQLADLHTQLGQLTQRIDGLQDTYPQIGNVQTELGQLRRDFDELAKVPRQDAEIATLLRSQDFVEREVAQNVKQIGENLKDLQRVRQDITALQQRIGQVDNRYALADDLPAIREQMDSRFNEQAEMVNALQRRQDLLSTQVEDYGSQLADIMMDVIPKLEKRINERITGEVVLLEQLLQTEMDSMERVKVFMRESLSDMRADGAVIESLEEQLLQLQKTVDKHRQSFEDMVEYSNGIREALTTVDAKFQELATTTDSRILEANEQVKNSFQQQLQQYDEQLNAQLGIGDRKISEELILLHDRLQNLTDRLDALDASPTNAANIMNQYQQQISAATNHIDAIFNTVNRLAGNINNIEQQIAELPREFSYSVPREVREQLEANALELQEFKRDTTMQLRTMQEQAGQLLNDMDNMVAQVIMDQLERSPAYKQRFMEALNVDQKVAVDAFNPFPTMTNEDIVQQVVEMTAVNDETIIMAQEDPTALQTMRASELTAILAINVPAIVQQPPASLVVVRRKRSLDDTTVESAKKPVESAKKRLREVDTTEVILPNPIRFTLPAPSTKRRKPRQRLILPQDTADSTTPVRAPPPTLNLQQSLSSSINSFLTAVGLQPTNQLYKILRRKTPEGPIRNRRLITGGVRFRETVTNFYDYFATGLPILEQLKDPSAVARNRRAGKFNGAFLETLKNIMQEDIRNTAPDAYLEEVYAADWRFLGLKAKRIEMPWGYSYKDIRVSDIISEMNEGRTIAENYAYYSLLATNKAILSGREAERFITNTANLTNTAASDLDLQRSGRRTLTPRIPGVSDYPTLSFNEWTALTEGRNDFSEFLQSVYGTQTRGLLEVAPRRLFFNPAGLLPPT